MCWVGTIDVAYPGTTPSYLPLGLLPIEPPPLLLLLVLLLLLLLLLLLIWTFPVLRIALLLAEEGAGLDMTATPRGSYSGSSESDLAGENDEYRLPVPLVSFFGRPDLPEESAALLALVLLLLLLLLPPPLLPFA